MLSFLYTSGSHSLEWLPISCPTVWFWHLELPAHDLSHSLFSSLSQPYILIISYLLWIVKSFSNIFEKVFNFFYLLLLQLLTTLLLYHIQIILSIYKLYNIDVSILFNISIDILTSVWYNIIVRKTQGQHPTNEKE